MTLIATRFVTVVTGGDGINHVTADVDFAPMNAMVNISISRLGTSGGSVQAGILEYRVRNDQGVDVPTSFGDPSNLDNLTGDALPAAVAHSSMTHITMLIMTFESWTRGLMTVFGTDFGQNSDQ
jgi:hypothetical protein